MSNEEESERREDTCTTESDPGTADQPFVSKSTSKRHQPITCVGDLYVALGNPGRMAVIMFCAVSFNFFAITTNHVSGVFFGYIPEHVCYPDLGLNKTTSSFLPASVYPDQGSNELNNVSAMRNGKSTMLTYQSCYVTISNGSSQGNLTRKCQPGEWRYKVDDGETSSVTEWDLVCDKTFLAHLANTFYYIGVTIGGFCIAYISDTIGRKVAILLCLYSVVFLGLGITFCQNFVLFVVLRTLMGIAAQALMTTSYIQVVEMFPPAYRGLAGSGIQSFWGMSMVYLSLMAWALQNWRHIQLACTVPAMVSGVYLLMMPESLRWLLSRGKTERAGRVVKRIYKCNNATNEECLDPHLMVRLSSKHTYEQQSFMDLCRAPVLRKHTIILAHVTFAINLGYWGFAYNTSKLVGNRYFNFFLGAVAEFAILTGNIYFVTRFGRKKPFILLFLIGGTCCIVLAFLPRGYSIAASTAVATLGRLSMSGLFSVGDLYATELFPTVIRTTGVSICVLTGRAAAMLTPMVFSLSDYTFEELPLLIFGATSLGGALLTMFLPETSKMELTDTVTETERKLSMKMKKGDIAELCDMEGLSENSTEKNPIKI